MQLAPGGVIDGLRKGLLGQHVGSRVTVAIPPGDGYGAQGSSGTPVFDRAGNLVAVLYGSERESAGRILYAVPMPFVNELLHRIPASR